MRGVGKRFGRRLPFVVEELDLAVAAGDGLRLSGANGSGKSTVLRLMTGVIRPTRGSVERGGGPVAWSPAEPVGGSSLPASAVLAAAARLHRRPGGEVAGLAERFQLAPHFGTPLGACSEGTRRKVNLVFALVAPPPALLVLDEPTAGLDGAAVDELGRVLAERRAAGAAVAIADHSDRLDVTLGLARWHVEGGRVRAAGPGRAPAMRIVATRGGEERSLVVPAGGGDAAIGALLGQGWSIRRVEPE